MFCYSKLRIMINLGVSFLSTIWLLPLWIAVKFVLTYLAWLENDIVDVNNLSAADGYPFRLSSISPFSMAQWFFGLSFIIAFLTIVFWIFLLSNRLWPIKEEK